MSADNESYVIKTPTMGRPGCEFRVGQAQAIENAEWPVISERNRYLRFAFGDSWVFGRQRRAVAMANVLEEEIECNCSGYGTEYGVVVILVDTPFPHTAQTPPQFGNDDGVYILKSPSRHWRGYDFRVVYSTSHVAAAATAVTAGRGTLEELQEGASLLLETFANRRGLYFSKRGRAVRAAHLINDDIASRGVATAHGVKIVEVAHWV